MVEALRVPVDAWVAVFICYLVHMLDESSAYSADSLSLVDEEVVQAAKDKVEGEPLMRKEHCTRLTRGCP